MLYWLECPQIEEDVVQIIIREIPEVAPWHRRRELARPGLLKTNFVCAEFDSGGEGAFCRRHTLPPVFIDSPILPT